MAYLRQSDDETILVALNFSKKEKKLSLPKSTWHILFSENRSGELSADEILLSPHEVILLQEK